MIIKYVTALREIQNPELTNNYDFNSWQSKAIN